MNPVTPASRHTPGLVFPLFWLGFTSVHAFFLVGGALKTAGWGTLLFLVPFYALFFGVGAWMLAQALRAVSLRRRYGNPALAALPPVVPGQALSLQVDFDRAWERQPPLAGEYRWVEVLPKGGSGKVLASAPLHGAQGPGPRGAQWSGMALLPPRPAGEGPRRLELVLQPQGLKAGQGWVFELPVTVAAATGAGEMPPVVVTPAQAAQVERVLRILMTVLLAAGSWLLYDALKGWPAVSPFGLVGPGALLLGALVVNDLRDTLRGLDLGVPLDKAREAERFKPFARRTRQRVQLFFTIAVALFFAEALDLLR